eukprot:gene7486-8280_t
MARGKKVLKIRAQAKKFTFKYQDNKAPEGVTGKYYPAEDVVVKKGPTPVRNAPKIRSTITPGTVLILLAGRFQGKRVVALKVLSSGLILVSGPYGVNGVPLRRVNQKYVIATSTKVSLDGVDVSKVDDAFFARKKEKKVKGEEALFATKKPVERLSPEKKALQDAIDAKLKANIDKVELLGAFLGARFRLSRNDKPHLMAF